MKARRASSVSTAALPLHLSDLLTLFNIEPAVGASLNAAAASVATSAGDAADAAVAVAVSSSSNNGGWLAPFAKGFEAFLKLLDGGLEAAHVPYSYGFSIILLTFLVKAATYPLTRKQMASTISLQALQPRVKEIQDRYKGRPAEEMQVEVARLYKEAGVNPLAGCLPTLVTLPVWIGLYRALSNAADDGLLSEGWFWIPSLAGPTSIAAQKAGAGSAWLFPLIDGAPPIGWEAAIKYLILPVLLTVSQVVSMRIMSPPSDDPAQKQTQAILKFLPLMIGWFSLNVPSGLTLYWITNNLLSTAQSMYLKATLATPAGAVAPMGSTTYVKDAVIDIDAEDARPSGKELNARRSSKASSSSGETSTSSSTSAISAQSSSSGGGSRGAKFRALKAKEAAKKASKQSRGGSGGGGGGGDSGGGGATEIQASSSPSPVATGDRPVVPDAPPSKD